MASAVVSDRDTVAAAFAAYRAACDTLAGVEVTGFDTAELLGWQSEREHCARITAQVDHRLHAVLQATASLNEIGGKTWNDVLCTRLRITGAEAAARLTAAADLGPRYTIGGDVLEPVLPAAAAALAAGAINGGHIAVVKKVVSAARTYVDGAECARIEKILVDAAATNSPATIDKLGAYVLGLLNPDGPKPDEAAHRRGIVLGRRDAGGLTKISGWIDAECAAYLATIDDVWGAPGINNPDDTAPIHNPTPNPLEQQDTEPAAEPVEPATGSDPAAESEPADHEPAGPDEPAADGPTSPTEPDEPVTAPEAEPEPAEPAELGLEFPTPQPAPSPDGSPQPPDGTSQAQAEPEAAQVQGEAAARDTRTHAQRTHDAFKAMARDLLMSKKLGQHGGLPVTVVVSTTLAELQAGAGTAYTHTGTPMTIPDLIRLGAHAIHYLLIYKHHTAEPMYLARTQRLASRAQRLVLYSRDRGCTRPGCTAPAGHCQAHHGDGDWTEGGQTNVDTLALGCGGDNRLASTTGWHTSIRKDGRIQWHPPPLLDTGQDTTNHHFHPEDLLNPPQDEEDEDP